MDDPAVIDAVRWLRGHLGGTIRFDEHHVPIKVVVDHDGRVIAPVMVAMLTATETILHLPDEDESSMQLMVDLESFEESGEMGLLADRWRIYHGEPPDVRWAVMHVDAARHGPMFIDGDALQRPNPLGTEEAALCRWANAERVDALRGACILEREIEIEDPRLVGVDEFGFDVRGLFEIVRLESPEPLHDADAARRALEAKFAAATGESV